MSVRTFGTVGGFTMSPPGLDQGQQTGETLSVGTSYLLFLRALEWSTSSTTYAQAVAFTIDRDGGLTITVEGKTTGIAGYCDVRVNGSSVGTMMYSTGSYVEQSVNIVGLKKGDVLSVFTKEYGGYSSSFRNIKISNGSLKLFSSMTV